MDIKDETGLLRTRVEELEQRVENLRVSRRVLMNLLEKVEREKAALIRQLEKENVRLQKNNKRYANWILRQNREMIKLQEEIEEYPQKA